MNASTFSTWVMIRKGQYNMSIKRFQNECSNTKTPSNTKNNDNIVNYRSSIHENMEKPKRYSMECGGDVHCITVMPNREVHFHNHNIKEMVHLVTFDILQNPDFLESKLDACLKVLRGLRTGITRVGSSWSRSDIEIYTDQLLSKNHIVAPARKEIKSLNNPIPWRKEVLNTFKDNIKKVLHQELGYYGMDEGRGNYEFKLDFEFNLTNSFMPNAKMEIRKQDSNNWGSRSVLHLDITVSPQWLIKVWKRGKAVINECLVLNIVKEYPNGTSLCMVAKQSHGFKIIPRLAVVDFEKQVLSWVIDPNRKDELLEGDKTPRKRRTKKEIMVEAIQPLIDVCNKEEGIINELKYLY